MKLARLGALLGLSLSVAAIAPAQLATASPVRSGASQDAASAGFHVPYTDPDQAGWLTLCNVALKPITHGSITARPFVWRVVSSVAAPKGYFVKGAKAQLFAYQPRPYTPAGAWSGTVLAAPSFYDNPAHPMAQFTPIDTPLTQMTVAFPPIWDHLIELRLYLLGPGLPELDEGYAAADLQITGNTWTLVAGGHSSCTDGSAVSEEVVYGMPGATGTPTDPAGGGGNSASGSAPTPSAGTNPTSSSGSSAGQAAAGPGSSSTPVAAVGAGVAVVVIAALVSGGVWWRRRRRAGL
jgi:hypothetical protein